MAEAEETDSLSSADPVILHILVVGFHHTRGSEVEFCYPKLEYGELDERPVMPPEWQYITALALPDGAHLTTEDSVYFILPDPKEEQRQLSAVACYRQIEAADLEVAEKDVKRRVVQKSVCVLSRQPLFGLIRHHLELTTHAYFREKNFTKTQILIDVYDHLNRTLHPSPRSPLSLSPHACISARKLVLCYGRKALVLFKLMLLEKKVLFFSHPVQRLCENVVSLLSLFPGVLENSIPTLHPPAPPVSSSVDEKPPNVDLSSTSDEFGFPLRFCRADCPALPYMSLQQMDNFKGTAMHGCVAAATNALFSLTPNLVDVRVDTDTGTVDIGDSELRNSLTLTIADQRFADQILSAVQLDEESISSGTNWQGGDDWVRLQFRNYLVSLLVCSASKDSRLLADFGTHFARSWKETYNYRHWILTAHPAITDIEPKHPCKGQIGLADFRDHNLTPEQLRQSMSDTKLRLGEALTPFSRKLTAAASSTREQLGTAAGTTRTELGGAIASVSSTIGGWFSSKRAKPSSSAAAPTFHLGLETSPLPEQRAKLSFGNANDGEDDDDGDDVIDGSRFSALPPSLGSQSPS